ncbi:hypothetical protein HY572_05315 [Candidatus Micrarchaeota archaeon]|nr:hypothetical protein [Candidatus Micrarchaeota archaeon]
MLEFFNRHLWAVLIVPTLLGLFFPAYFSVFAPYAVPLLFAVMVLSLLDVPLVESFRSGLNAQTTGIVFIQYVVSGLLALAAAQFFDPALLIGFVVMGVVPSGISAPALVSVFKGNTGKAFAVTTVAYAVAPIATPVLVLVLAGQSVAIDAATLFQSVILYIVIPLVLVIVLRKTPAAKPLANVKRPLSVALLLVLVSGQVAESSSFFYSQPLTFGLILLVLVLLSFVKLFLGTQLAKNKKDEIAFAQLAYHKNGTLALTLLTTLFTPAAAAVAVAHIISSQVMFVYMARRFR